MTLSRSKIEYVLNPDGSPGYSYPIFTGCSQPASVCYTRDLCWARGLHRRFKDKGWAELYDPDFRLKFNECLKYLPALVRKPSTFAVAFTADMFGPGSERFWRAQEQVLAEVRRSPQHRFLFLTKSPENLARHNPWPPNAWVGCTFTGAESAERQQEIFAALGKVQGGERWISFEPILGPVYIHTEIGESLSWVVIGAQTGPRAMKPKLEWISDIIAQADYMRIPIWIKNNLLQLFPQYYNLLTRQERPR